MERNIPVLKSQDAVPQSPETRVTRLVALRELVRRTVGLDYQLVLQEHEVGDERPDRFLSAEPHSKAISPQLLPEGYL